MGVSGDDAFRRPTQAEGHGSARWRMEIRSGTGGKSSVVSLQPASEHPRPSLGSFLQSWCRIKQRQQERLQRTRRKQEGRASRDEEGWPSGLSTART